MLSKKKISPSKTALFSASILEMICNLESNKVTKEIHHRVRELNRKLEKISSIKIKFSKTKKYFEKSIEKALEVREISKELEMLAVKIGKLHDKVILPDIKNAVYLAKAAGKSALENIKINKEALKKTT
jgi:formiminotetrahydrofolate cyclodeaminase